MDVRHDRIARVQARMREEGLVAIVIVNHDDYRYLFGTDRVQPRAIIPVEGPPTIIAFAGEEPEIRASLAAARRGDGGPHGGDVLVFGSVGGQIHEVVGLCASLVASASGRPADGPRRRSACRCGSRRPAFLVELFRKVNPGIEVVSSDPVMDPLRMVKDDGELALMAEAQRVAGIGMDRARELLRPGVTAHEIATEVDLRDDAGRRRADEHADLRHLRDRDLHAPRPPQPAPAAARRAGGDRPDAAGRGLLREPRPDVRPRRAGRAPAARCSTPTPS